MTSLCDRYLPADADGIRARVGLVSDTHAPQRCPELPQAMFDAFEGVNAILHAGDVGDLSVLDRLGEVAPVVAVHGNDETHEAPLVLPEKVVVQVAGVRLFMAHGHRLRAEADARPERPDDWPTILDDRRRLADGTGADVVVFGHLHVPMAVEQDGLLFVNPGIVGHSHVVLRSTVRSVALLFVGDDLRVVHVDVETGEAFEPDVDWDGGYWASMDRINESIVHPSLGGWQEFWRTLRDVDQSVTWRALLAVATRCWTGETRWITRDLLHAELTRDPRVDRDLLDAYERVLDDLA